MFQHLKLHYFLLQTFMYLTNNILTYLLLLSKIFETQKLKAIK